MFWRAHFTRHVHCFILIAINLSRLRGREVARGARHTTHIGSIRKEASIAVVELAQALEWQDGNVRSAGQMPHGISDAIHSIVSPGCGPAVLSCKLGVRICAAPGQALRWRAMPHDACCINPSPEHFLARGATRGGSPLRGQRCQHASARRTHLHGRGPGGARSDLGCRGPAVPRRQGAMPGCFI